LKKPLDIESRFRHSLCIRLDEYKRKEYSRLSGCEEAVCRNSFWSR
jgi:hypothetical protein